jgi:cellulose synthase/poly-beta-1,6-N-acetylglucosamine synthase-like glycosyltransferase
MREPDPQEQTRDAALDAAIHALNRRDRSLSARSVFSAWQVVVLLALGVGAWRLAHAEPAFAVALARAVLWSLFSAFVVLRLFAAAASMARGKPSGPGWQGALPAYTVLCPLHREAASAPAIVHALARLDYPSDKRDVKLVVEADDAETLAVIDTLTLPEGFTLVRVPPARPRTKPKALNYAMASARGDFVAVFDAEDAPRPDQLRAALDAFARDEKLGAVQSPLVIDNGEASWLASQFAAEYSIQFRGILPLLAHVRAPLPLGGAGNHFRRTALEDAGGWDAWNVTEDADLSYRLARKGWRIGVIDSPTYEEAPARLGPWMRQRSRWIKGHLQTWLVLMRDPWRTAREMGFGGFLWMQLVLGGGLVAACAHAPLFAFLLLNAVAPEIANVSPTDWALVITGYATSALAALFAAVIERDRRLALSALTMPLYWPLSSFAALLAVVEIVVSPHYWAKTDHALTPRKTHIKDDA